MRKILLNGLGGLLIVLTCSMKMQQKTVTGTVSDESGLALSGASVMIKGTTQGVSTHGDGNFAILVDESDVLSISYAGYVAQEIAVAGKTRMNIVLETDRTQLDEVVVVGFGTQKKSTISGSVTHVEMDEILGDRPITDASTALQGIAPGLEVVNFSGQPGTNNTSIELRGFGNINQATPPLILLDNVEVNIRDVNPNDIEDVVILKDAAAASIYGAKGAWGVILITTKKPSRDQKVKFEYRNTLSLSQPMELPEKGSVRDFVNVLQDVGVNRYFTNQNVDTWLNYLDDYAMNPGNYPEGRVLDADGFIYSLREENPIQQLLDNNGKVVKHDFSFSGGSGKSTYRVSSSYSDEDGVIVTANDRYKKYNVNAFLDTDLAKNLKSTTNIFYKKSGRSNPAGRYNLAVNEPVYSPTGYFTLEDGTVLPFNSPDNLERLLPHSTVNSDVLRMYQKLEYEPIERLKLSGEFTYERGSNRNKSTNIQLRTVDVAQFVPNSPNPELTNVQKSFSERELKTFNFYADYALTFSDAHQIDVKLGINREEAFSNGFNVSRLNLISTDVPFIDAALGTIDGSDNFSETATLGYFGRLQYNFKEKYFIEGNIRYDGSSKFPKNQRYGVFSSISAAWNLKNESFLEHVDWLSLLKLFGSYGEIGNQDLPQAYPYISEWTPRPTWLLNESGIRHTTIEPGLLVSPSLTWERAQKGNLGLDVVLLRNRLSSTVEIYQNKTLGMLIPGAELPAALGAAAPFTNAGDLETNGWEFSMGWRDRAGVFSYGLNANISNNKTKITKFDNPAGLISQYYNGYQIGTIFGYQTDGYYTMDDFVPGTLDADLGGPNRQLNPDVVVFEEGIVPFPGDIKYKDLDGDGVITDGNNTLDNLGDRKIIGNDRRQLIYGLNGFLSYQNFDLSFAFSGVGKRDRVLSGAKAFPYQSQFDHIFLHQLDYWTPDNQDAYYPRMFGDGGGDRGNYGRNRRTQTKYLRDAAYFKINNITLAYSLPTALVERINFNSIRVFLSGENLHTFHKLPQGIDPDVNEDGAYPLQRTFALGVQVSF